MPGGAIRETRVGVSLNMCAESLELMGSPVKVLQPAGPETSTTVISTVIITGVGAGAKNI